jgi:hypothetical protein
VAAGAQREETLQRPLEAGDQLPEGGPVTRPRSAGKPIDVARLS